MSQSPPADPEQPHIVSLVLHAKKALLQGQQLCTRASTISSASAQTAVDVLALDAQVRWMSEAVLDQLKLAAQVAKSIEQKRTELERQVKEWDIIRNQRTDALDAVLESLGTQSVPPDFHTVSSDSSPFGSQNNSDDERDEERHPEDDTTPFGPPPPPSSSPTDTIRNRSPVVRRHEKEKKSRREDRRKWKTLRDFVNERAIEDLLDTIEKDRLELDDILATTSDYPESLSKTIGAIKDMVPVEVPLPSFDAIFASQEGTSAKMAEQLESLAHHYDNMSNALHDFEAGEEFSEEDVQGMNGDADALPVIITELEEGVKAIDEWHQQLLTAKESAQEHLEVHRNTLRDLDELGDIMTEMLERQQTVETESIEHLSYLHAQLQPLEELHHKYTSYQYAYGKLVLELARRQRYREAAQRIIATMTAQLDAMAEEERILRQEFQAEHGQYIPEDFCLYVENLPNRWMISTWNGEPLEMLPLIDADIIEEAKQRTMGVDIGVGASQSL
ncbi:autophagy protein Apg17-domain-containing protein [Dichomitus squalens]|uniref:Autophagy-related protein 17 n=1 Tax=Dichomitus squalens TaxID=114155 RepID=A0A4Q9MA35_9APHY|nr:autophagy protein Apg17-domain-containing protein [Dichomitus squalens]